MQLAVFWFRRDLRLEDNTGLNKALGSGRPVLPLFIFDSHILDELPEDDARVTFIYESLEAIQKKIRKSGGSLLIRRGSPLGVWEELVESFDISAVYVNRDYEPYARERDRTIRSLLSDQGIPLYDFKDQVIFDREDIQKEGGGPYSVYTPYQKRWLRAFELKELSPVRFPDSYRFHDPGLPFPHLGTLGFKKSSLRVPPYRLSDLEEYPRLRDIPAADATSRLSPHLRFGTVGIRTVISNLGQQDGTFLGELIWREFFMQILYHFPRLVTENFHTRYDGIRWRNSEAEFEKWCEGKTGYPFVDAGMRQLNQTGWMHNRVRMVAASFLCKHLLVDWRWGEAYFAEKLLDYELSSNNGNWQWAAGTGCDAAPWFRIFNPRTQLEKFDSEMKYVKKWIPEFGTPDYPEPMVDHKKARDRALNAYKSGTGA